MIREWSRAAHAHVKPAQNILGSIEKIQKIGCGKTLPLLALSKDVKISVLSSPADIELACKRHLGPLDFGKKPELVVSLDTEWYRGGSHVSVVQMVFHDTPDEVLVQMAEVRYCLDVTSTLPVFIYVYFVSPQLYKHRKLSPSFICVITDPRVIKVGVCVKGDLTRLTNNYPEDLKGDFATVDIRDKYLRHGPVPEGQTRSLAGLVERFLHRQPPKPTDIRMGNWDVEKLSAEQIKYSMLVYEEIMRLSRAKAAAKAGRHRA